jgi:hypothetical protein
MGTIIGSVILGKFVAIGFLSLCAYYFLDGKKNPHKYKPFTMGGDMFPIGAIIDEPNADFHVATACIDAELIDECCLALKSLKIKMSKAEVEDFIITNSVETVEGFVSKLFQEKK